MTQEQTREQNRFFCNTVEQLEQSVMRSINKKQKKRSAADDA
jgi:hypothetical protein